MERLSIDESFLDVTGSLHLFGQSPRELADKIRQRVWDDLNITVSVGVSYNKIFAKMASDMKKPNGTTVLTLENYKDILWPMPAGRLYSVGKVTAEKLSFMGILTIGDIAKAPRDFLVARLGKAGDQLHRYANGLDESIVLKVNEGEAVHSVGNGQTFKRDLVSWRDITVALTALSDTVASRLRRQNIKCTTVQVMIKDPKFKTITRQTGVVATWLAADISRETLKIMKASWRIGSPIRMLTVTASNLISPEEVTEQLSLFEGDENSQDSSKKESLEKTLDSIRHKYGRSSISPGSVVKNDLGINERYDGDDLPEDKDSE